MKVKILVIIVIINCITIYTVKGQNEEFEVSESHYKINLNENNGFRIGFGLSFGAGRSEFSYDIVESAPGLEASDVISRKFSASYTNIQIPITLAYSFKGISIGAKLVLTDTRATDIMALYSDINGDKIEGAEKQFWFKNRTYYGPFIEYDFKLAPSFYISPNYSYSWYGLGKKGNTFFKNEQITNSLDYNEAFIARNSSSFGIKFKFAANSETLLSISLAHYVDNMQPSSDYFKEGISNFKHSSSYTYIGLDYMITI